MRELPVRGTDVRELGLALPPTRMRAHHRGRALKRWRYVGVYRSDLMLCVGAANVGGIPQRWWAVALPDGTLFQGHRGVAMRGSRVRAGSAIDLELQESDGVEVVSPHGRGWV